LQPWEVRITLDGRLRHSGALLFASTLNTPSYGAGMAAVPHARFDDSRLDLLVAGAFGRLGVLAMLPRLARGSHLRHPQVRTRAFASMRLQSNPALPLAADGEPLPAAAEFEVRVRAASLSMVAAPG
jgi:diacylglycerol kinase family enzyme